MRLYNISLKESRAIVLTLAAYLFLVSQRAIISFPRDNARQVLVGCRLSSRVDRQNIAHHRQLCALTTAPNIPPKKSEYIES